MATHGTLGEFDRRTSDWKSYVERTQQYFAANEVTNVAKQRAILISSVGDSTYRTMKDVLSPDSPASVPLPTIIEKMTNHFQPQPSEIVQRFQFHTRVRHPHESVADYIARLKQIAGHCNFGDAARVNEMLRDRLVCGIANEKWQQRLLAEDDLTYAKAQTTLLSLEAAEKGLKDIAGDTKKVQYLQSRRKLVKPQAKPSEDTQKSQQCKHCGNNHDSNTCRFKRAECNYCHKRGHIAAICRQRLKRQSGPSSQTCTKNTTHLLEVEEED